MLPSLPHALFALTLLSAAANACQSSATRSVAGHFNGGFDPDVVILQGSDIELHYGAYDLPFTFSAGVTANDVTLAAGRGPGGVDAFAWVGPTGLHVSHYTPQQPTQLFEHVPLTAAGGWADAARVVAARDAAVFVGLASNSSTVLVYDETADTTTSFALPTTALDLTLLDFDGDGADDAFIACTGGVRCIARDGTVLHDTAQPLDEAFLARITDASLAYDRVAMAAKETGSSDHRLFTMDMMDASTGAEPPASLGPFEAHSVTSGDLDQDGREDLVLMHRTPLASGVATPLRFYNMSGTNASTFSLAAFVRWELDAGGTPGASQQAWPVLADFTRDGDLDVALYLEETEDLAFAANPLNNHEQHVFEFTRIFAKHCGTATDNIWLMTEIDEPGAELAGAQAIYVEHWHAELSLDGTQLLIPADGAIKIDAHVWDWGQDFSVQNFVGNMGSGDVRFLRFFLAQQDTQGNTLAVGPTTKLAYTMNPALQDDLIASGVAGNLVVKYVYEESTSCHLNGVGGNPDGGGGVSDPPRPPGASGGNMGMGNGPDDPPVTGP